MNYCSQQLVLIGSDVSRKWQDAARADGESVSLKT